MKSLRYYLLIILGIAAIAALFIFEHYSIDLLNKRNKIYHSLYRIRVLENKIGFELVKNSLFHHDYIQVRRTLENYRHEIQRLSNLLYDFPKLSQEFAHLRSLAKQKEELLQKYRRHSLAVKRSIIAITELLQHLPALHIQNYDYKKSVIATITSIISSLHGSDPSHLKEVEKNLQKLRSFSFKDPKLARLNSRLIAQVAIFLDHFPKLKRIMEESLILSARQSIRRIAKELDAYFDAKLRQINIIFEAIILFYIFLLFMIFFFIYRLDQENEKLQKLQLQLSRQALSDDLTHLLNRRAYKKDVKKIKKPFFALINIDGFKHYNDFYGIAMGDHILRECAKILQNCVPPHYEARFYRVGADEFAILIREESPIEDGRFAKKIIKTFAKTPITFKSITINLSVSVAMSRKRPLLETADLTMKHIKKEKRLKYLTYSDELGLLQEIRQNVKKSKILKEAIKEHRIIPYFQPIIDSRTETVAKYEVLARLRHRDGRIESIYPYLQIAKELGLYDTLSKQIITQAVKTAYRLDKKISVNISMKDIENPEFIDFLGHLFHKYEGIAPKLSFEILESETLKDYRSVEEFISMVRSLGSEVGIDDFGSGYSNFSHIFNLDIDFIKIDGSLIKNLDTNATARLIVENIVSIANRLDIKTVAEFIPDRTIFTIVRELGVDLAQGFYLGEPAPLTQHAP